MTRIKAILIGLMMLTLSACSTLTGGETPGAPFGQRVADNIVVVDDQNRDLRVCWLAAGVVEVLTDLAQRGGGEEALSTLSHVMLLQATTEGMRAEDSFWIETNVADVSLIFARVLHDVGRSRLGQILLGGFTISNFVDVAKRTIILTVKGDAVMLDINRVLTGVKTGDIPKADAWEACESRTAMNGNVLRALTGMLLVEKRTFGTEYVELDLIFPDGRIDPKDGDIRLALKDTILIEGYGGIDGWEDIGTGGAGGGVWEERVGIGRPIA